MKNWEIKSFCALHGVLNVTDTTTQCNSECSCLNFDQLHSVCTNCQEDECSYENILHTALLSEVKAKGLQAEYGLNIANFLTDFIDWHNGKPLQLKKALDFIYTFLDSIPREYDESWISNDRFCGKLTELLLECTAYTDQNKAANIMVILLLCVQRFKQTSSIEQLWSNILRSEDDGSMPSELRLQIIMNFFDEFVRSNQNFHCDKVLVKITRRHLTSVVREERKASYYILKKILEFCLKHKNKEWFDCGDYVVEHLSIYITILENLEENQSHLILPSLELLPVIENFEQPSWVQWMEILYERLLDHNNILAIRYTLEHFLRSNISDNLTFEVLRLILNAFNNTLLYNYEGYFIPIKNIENFIYKHKLFIDAFADIKWKSVPLHFWLTQLMNKKEAFKEGINYSLIIKIAYRIRLLQNAALRGMCIVLFKTLFEEEIEMMTLQKYITFVTTLHNIKDCEYAREILPTVANKMVNFSEKEQNELDFTEQFYHILSNSLEVDEEEDNNNNIHFETVVQFLQSKPIKSHGWLRFFIVFDSSEKKPDVLKQFCKTIYNLDIDSVAQEQHIDNVVKELKSKLSICSKEKSIAMRCIDFFILQNIKNINQITDWDILDSISYKAIHKLAMLIAKEKSDTIPIEKFFMVIKRLINERIDCYDISFNLLKYCKQNLLPKKCQEYAETLLLLDFENKKIHFSVLNSDITLSTESYVRGMLYGEVKTGEARVEQIYKYTMGEMNFSEVRHEYVFRIPRTKITDVLEELKNKSLQIGRKKLRYFENSDEHRLQMRIAYAFSRLALDGKIITVSTFLELLTMESNHSNVNIIYEFLIAKIANSKEILNILTQIPQYSPSHQISVIIIAHTFCIANEKDLSDETICNILDELLPLTMGANFQIRLYSQLAMYNIIGKRRKLHDKSWSHTFNAIKRVLGESAIRDLMDDIRLKISDEELQFNIFFIHSIVMYIANAPLDEYLDIDNKYLFEKSRVLYAKKICNYAKSSSNATSAATQQSNINYLQRKLNPTNDALWQNDLKISNTQKCDIELIVVASLIDKLPNLGGIARTCEVLGIKNLVLNTISCIQKPDFKNLSMTAENGLNIMEVKGNELPNFLMQKQAEGFKIVGAEQTANSVSFVNFQFPKKTILMLGHEKEGIPPNLLQFLDYAVEIPQSGLVRSLNVHVTAALFIWQFCNQHTVNTSK